MDADNIRHSAEEIASSLNESNSKFFTELFEGIEDIPDDALGFDELGVLLAMDEKQFALLSPLFIDTFQKSLNNVGDKVLLVQTLNAAGIKFEQLQEFYKKLIGEVEEKMGDSISPQKIDFLKKFFGILTNVIAEVEGIARRIVQIPIKLEEGATMPQYAHVGDAGADLYAMDDYDIKPGETVKISFGVSVEIPVGYAIIIQPRSGLSSKTKLRITNTPGLIDSSYRGVIHAAVENIANPIEDIDYEFLEDGSIKVNSILHGKVEHISKGERIAQMRLVEVPIMNFYEVNSISNNTDRGEGGYGSSGTH